MHAQYYALHKIALFTPAILMKFGIGTKDFDKKSVSLHRSNIPNTSQPLIILL
jgi:hypothetical protein